MKAVSADCLQSVCDALTLLQESGLSDISNIAEMKAKVSESLLNVEGFTTENMAMSEWAQTPEMWLAAERPEPRSSCKLEGGSSKEIASKTVAAIERHQANLSGLQGNNQGGDNDE